MEKIVRKRDSGFSVRVDIKEMVALSKSNTLEERK